MIFNYKHAKVLAFTWDRELRLSHPDRSEHISALISIDFLITFFLAGGRKLVFCYLANDVMQNSRKKGRDYMNEFGAYLSLIRKSLSSILALSAGHSFTIFSPAICQVNTCPVSSPTSRENACQRCAGVPHPAAHERDASMRAPRSPPNTTTTAAAAAAQVVESALRLCGIWEERQIFDPSFVAKLRRTLVRPAASPSRPATRGPSPRISRRSRRPSAQAGPPGPGSVLVSCLARVHGLERLNAIRCLAVGLTSSQALELEVVAPNEIFRTPFWISALEPCAPLDRSSSQKHSQLAESACWEPEALSAC